MRNKMRRLLVAAAFGLLGAAPVALAAGEAHHPEPHNFSFDQPLGGFDQGAVQRGFQVYTEVCSACHTLNNLSYRHLGEPGGPFVASGKYNSASGSWEDVKLGPPHHGGRVILATDNPYVRAIAEQHEVTEIDPTTAEEVTRKARPADRFVSPYTNPYQAKALHGVAPPDLSNITKARKGGADYVASLLVGYTDPPPGLHAPASNLQFNKFFHGGWISMPPQLTDGRVTYSDGTKATPHQMAKDVTTFLAWASDPKQVERKKMGFTVMIYLLILAGFLYAAYKQVWRGVKH
jgi:cytochrome c1